MRLFHNLGTHRSARRPRSRRRLTFDVLEDRCLLTGLTVFNVGDGRNPFGITTGSDGNIWFGEDLQGRIGRLTPTGALTEFAIPDTAPLSLTLGPDGNVWYYGAEQNVLGRITPTGQATEFALPLQPSLPPAGAPAHLFAVGPGAFWLDATGALQEIPIPANDGDPAHPLTPGEVAVSAAGDVWFTEQGFNAIGHLSPTGVFTEYSLPSAAGTGGAVGLWGIAVGPDGTAWATEYTADRIARITAAGIVTEFSLPAGTNPSHVTVGADGHVWYTALHQLGRISDDGTVTQQTVVTNLNSPDALTIGVDGAIWFGDGLSHVDRYDPAAFPAAAPVPLTAVEGTLVQATVATIMVSNPQAVTATINWGNGQTTPGTLTPNAGGGFDVTGETQFSSAGTFPVSVTLADAAGDQTVVQSQVTVPDTFGPWLTRLYQDLLGRAAEAAGKTFWEGQLAAGATYAQVVQAFENSPEYWTAQIQHDYQTLLGRAADAGGLSFFLQQLSSGVTMESVEATILTSDEYYQKASAVNGVPNIAITAVFGKPTQQTLNYVTTLFQDILGRTPEDAGFAYWTNRLAVGIAVDTPAGTALDILHSAEDLSHTVTDWYENFLQRAPDAAGLSFWQGELAQGIDPNQVLANFLSGTEYVTQPATSASVVAPSAAAAVNQFATDLYAQLAGTDGNLAFSPLGIETALAMAYAGAGGQTAAEMAQVLHLGPNTAATHDAYGALLSAIVADGNATGSELDVADALWGQTGYAFTPEFLALLQSAYGADLQRVDFAGAPEQARATINAAVSQETHGKIPELFPAGSLDTATRLALTNAVYFQGNWARPFDPNFTQDGTFTTSAGQAVTVPLMHLSSSFSYGDQDGMQTLEMAYQGGHLAMDVLLPDQPDGLATLEQQLTPAHLATWLSDLQPQNVAVTLPRFQVTTATDLRGVLSALGMPSAFDPLTADFSGMNGGTDPLFLSSAIHQAYVSVGETGTEAAAATGLGVSTTAVPANQNQVTFLANHPFVYLIRDTATNTVLFLGRVTDPS